MSRQASTDVGLRSGACVASIGTVWIAGAAAGADAGFGAALRGPATLSANCWRTPCPQRSRSSTVKVRRPRTVAVPCTLPLASSARPAGNPEPTSLKA
ncbi:hypothetical protein D3C87_1316010 [compost metagenome]